MRKVSFTGLVGTTSKDPKQRIISIESMVRQLAQASQENDIIDIASAYALGTFTPTRTLGAAVSLLTGVTPSYVLKTFSSNGTYTPSPGMVAALMFAFGSGGAGGGVVGGTNLSLGGGGGGSGGMSISLRTAAAVGASQTVTIGTAASGVSGANGGNGSATSIGTLCIANGGNGGNFNNGTTNFGIPGIAGTPNTGDMSFGGTNGGQGCFVSGTAAPGFAAISGYGANGLWFGGGGAPEIAGNSSTNVGNPAINVGGAGGSGAATCNNVASAAGGASLAGFAFIIEFCNSTTSDGGSIWNVLATLLSDMKAGGMNRTT